MGFILLEIGKRDLEDTALQVVVCVLETSGSVDEGFTNTLHKSRSARLFSCIEFRIGRGVFNYLDGGSYSRTWKVVGAYIYFGSLIIHIPVRLRSRCQKHQGDSTYLHEVLILSCERVHGSLLEALLALRQTLVPGFRGG